MIFAPLYPRDEICKRAKSLIGIPAHFPKKEGFVDCIDIPAYAYGYPEDFIVRDLTLWVDLHNQVIEKTGWIEQAKADRTEGDLVLIYFNGPHLGVYVQEDKIVHACSSRVHLSSFKTWNRYVLGVLTWQQRY